MGKVKTNNIFDYLQTDPENIDEKTVYENTGVNKENVREILMKKVNESKAANAPKKNGRKKLTISLIAAAAAVAVLGTTAAATGTFNPIFGQMFAGEAASGAYTGGNVKIDSDKLNIDFEGIVGDAHNAYSMMRITKKDGSAFTEDTDQILFISSSKAQQSNRDENNAQVTVSHSLMDTIFNSNSQKYDCINYYFEDDYTLTACMVLNDENNLIGSTAYIDEDELELFRVDEIIYTKAEFDHFRELDEDDEFWSDGLGIFEKAEREYEKRNGHPLAENQAVMFDFNERNEMNNIVVAHYDTLEVDYDLSVQLNYKDTAVSFDSMKGQKINIDGKDKTVTELKVEPFSMTLKTHQDHNESVPKDEQMIDYDKEQEEFENQDLYELTITLDNGNEYYAELSGQGGTGGGDFFDEEYNYDSFTDGKRTAIINPSKIVSITYKDKVLYQA